MSTKTIKPTSKTTNTKSSKNVTKTTKTETKPVTKTIAKAAPKATIKPRAAAPVVKPRPVAAATRNNLENTELGRYIHSMSEQLVDGPSQTGTGRYDITVKSVDLGLIYAERAFQDTFRDVPFSMRLSDNLGTMYYRESDDSRWGIYYADRPIDGEQRKFFHISELDLVLQSAVAGRLQAFWDVGVSEQRNQIGMGISAMESLQQFAMNNLAPRSATSRRPVISRQIVSAPASA